MAGCKKEGREGKVRRVCAQGGRVGCLAGSVKYRALLKRGKR